MHKCSKRGLKTFISGDLVFVTDLHVSHLLYMLKAWRHNQSGGVFLVVYVHNIWVLIINKNLSIYMAHISSLGLFMAPYIILSLVIGPVCSCTNSTPRGAYSTATM